MTGNIMAGKIMTDNTVAGRLTGKTLVIATHNPGKLTEIEALLAPRGVSLVSAGELGLPEPEETGATFAANAVLKAQAAAQAAGLPALADDSGVAVAALGGQPGIHAARWAGPDKDFAAAMSRVEHELGEAREKTGQDDRRAAFICVLCLAWPGGETQCFEGRIEGSLVWPPRGGRGFGYDPMFMPEGYGETFGEMDPAMKHAISHRARAFEKFVAATFGPGI